MTLEVYDGGYIVVTFTKIDRNRLKPQVFFMKAFISTTYPLFFIAVSAMMLLTSCSADESLPIPAPPANDCTRENGSLSWTSASNDYCSNSQLYASNQGGVAISAVTKTGVTLNLFVDNPNVGTYPMSALQNGLLYTDQLGNAWSLANDPSGTLTITSHNTSTKTIKGSFFCTVRNSIGSELQISNGMIDLTYTE